MRSRLIVALVALAATFNLARAAELEKLTVLRDCPAQGWHRACLPVAFFFKDDKSGRLHIRSENGHPTWHDNIVVDGFLLEGKGTGPFRLDLGDQRVSEIDALEELGAFAYLGRSLAGRPIVLTDRGPLEIRTPSLTFSSDGDLFVVGEKTGKLLSRFVHGYGMPFVTTKRGEIGVWDATRAVCISAPKNSTHRFAIITTACKAAGLPADGTIVGGSAVKLLDGDYDEGLVKAIIGDPNSYQVYKLPGTNLLVIWVRYYSCC